VEISQVSPLGAGEVRGLDASRPFDDATLRELRAAFAAYPILVFRDQPLSVPELVAFTEQFGELEISDRSNYAHPDHDAVLILSNELRPDGTAVGVVDAGDFLHSDMQFSPTPATATILQAIRNPSRGGDTEFCNMYQVYDALPDDVRRRAAGRTAINHPSKLRNPRVLVSTARPDAKEYYAATESLVPDMHHPVIRTHPETGKQAVYVSPRFSLAIDGLEPAESDELLDAIFAVMADKQFRYRHRWRDDDIVMWDNRCLTHRATGGYLLPDIRRMHRTQIQGEVPFYTESASAMRHTNAR
jgi:taurine dioxygenase